MSALAAARSRDLIIVDIGGQQFAVDVLQVREIRGWTSSTTLPHTPSHVLGMLNLRGQVVPVISAAVRLGVEGRPPDASSVVLIAQIRQRLIGVLVDAVCDLIALNNEEFQSTPQVGSADMSQLINGVIVAGGGMVPLLSLEAVVADSEPLA